MNQDVARSLAWLLRDCEFDLVKRAHADHGLRKDAENERKHYDMSNHNKVVDASAEVGKLRMKCLQGLESLSTGEKRTLKFACDWVRKFRPEYTQGSRPEWLKKRKRLALAESLIG